MLTSTGFAVAPNPTYQVQIMNMVSKFSFFSVLFTLMMCTACSNGAIEKRLLMDNTDLDGRYKVVTPEETFNPDVDKPLTTALGDYSLLTPWGYDRPANSARTYPILVSGMYMSSNNYSEAVKQKYPSFFLDFGTAPSDQLGAALADLIDTALQAGYRIDENRIYLTGFSQGGSGSFSLVRGMNTRGKLFAGILRFAGQSQSEITENAARKTSVWYHIGLTDDAIRVTVARETYDNIKNHPANATARETTVTDTITGYSRMTKTLTKDGVEIFKMSEYAGMGHTSGPCYKDPYLVDWLFAQSLRCREEPVTAVK